jgi:hypothetical protein
MALVQVPGSSTAQAVVATSDEGADLPLPFMAQPLCPTLAQLIRERARGGAASPPPAARAGHAAGPFAQGDSVGVQPTAADVALRYLLVFPNNWMLESRRVQQWRRLPPPLPLLCHGSGSCRRRSRRSRR